MNKPLPPHLVARALPSNGSSHPQAPLGQHAPVEWVQALCSGAGWFEMRQAPQPDGSLTARVAWEQQATGSRLTPLGPKLQGSANGGCVVSVNQHSHGAARSGMQG